jgi:hypothetical protein
MEDVLEQPTSGLVDIWSRPDDPRWASSYMVVGAIMRRRCEATIVTEWLPAEVTGPAALAWSFWCWLFSNEPVSRPRAGWDARRLELEIDQYLLRMFESLETDSQARARVIFTFCEVASQLRGDARFVSLGTDGPWMLGKWRVREASKAGVPTERSSERGGADGLPAGDLAVRLARHMAVHRRPMSAWELTLVSVPEGWSGLNQASTVGLHGPPTPVATASSLPAEASLDVSASSLIDTLSPLALKSAIHSLVLGHSPEQSSAMLEVETGSVHACLQDLRQSVGLLATERRWDADELRAFVAAITDVLAARGDDTIAGIGTR